MNLHWLTPNLATMKRNKEEKEEKRGIFNISRYWKREYPHVCRRQDLNLHWVNPNQALNLARLPIPPLRLEALNTLRQASHGIKSPRHATAGFRCVITRKAIALR